MVEAAVPRRGRPPSGGREAILAATVDLLREVGASKLTTREVARRAGVSEGSVFYHFTDRFGLLRAVIEDGLGAIREFPDPPTSRPEEGLGAYAAAMQRLVHNGLVVLVAAQSDADLKAAMTTFITENRLGPRRGVQRVSGYLAQAQREGAIRPDVDPDAAAFLLLGAVFLSAAMPELISAPYAKGMPSLNRVAETLAALLTP